MTSTFIQKVIRENLTRVGLENDGSNIYRVVHPLRVFKSASVYGSGAPGIVNLIIPKGALVHIPKRPSSYWADEWKCRASQAIVHSIVTKRRPHRGVDRARSHWEYSFIYRAGEPVYPSGFYRQNSECAEGIHFFFDLEQALHFWA